MSIIKPDIMSCAGNLQLSAGVASGYEAAVHAIGDILEEQSTDALLFIDADNDFNSHNHKVVLHIIRYLCRPMQWPFTSRTVIVCHLDCSCRVVLKFYHPKE